MLDVVFGGKTKATIGVVSLDASISETHTRNAEVTSHPVEDGADISDHIRLEPETLSIRGIVSDTPIVWLATFRSPSPIVDDITTVNARVDLAYAELQRVMNEGELVSVVTSLRAYENMAITGMSVRRDASTGNVLDVDLDLREVILAGTQTVEAPPEPSAAARKAAQSQGTQATSAAASSTPGPSALFSLFGG